MQADFVTEIYKSTDSFPEDEILGLKSQMRRAAVSIPSNIAEGNLRRGKQFLKTSRAAVLRLKRN